MSLLTERTVAPARQHVPRDRLTIWRFCSRGLRRRRRLLLVILRSAVLLRLLPDDESLGANHGTTIDRDQTRRRINVQRDRPLKSGIIIVRIRLGSGLRLRRFRQRLGRQTSGFSLGICFLGAIRRLVGHIRVRFGVLGTGRGPVDEEFTALARTVVLRQQPCCWIDIFLLNACRHLPVPSPLRMVGKRDVHKVCPDRQRRGRPGQS